MGGAGDKKEEEDDGFQPAGVLQKGKLPDVFPLKEKLHHRRAVPAHQLEDRQLPHKDSPLTEKKTADGTVKNAGQNLHRLPGDERQNDLENLNRQHGQHAPDMEVGNLPFKPLAEGRLLETEGQLAAEDGEHRRGDPQAEQGAPPENTPPSGGKMDGTQCSHLPRRSISFVSIPRKGKKIATKP